MEAPNHAWTYDLTFDETIDERKLKFLAGGDEYSQQCLRIEGRRSLGSKSGSAGLRQTGALRSDNGPEFARACGAGLARRAGVSTFYFKLGSPWKTYAESFINCFQHEFLSRELFNMVVEAQVLVEKHRLRHKYVVAYRAPAGPWENYDPFSEPLPHGSRDGRTHSLAPSSLSAVSGVDRVLPGLRSVRSPCFGNNILDAPVGRD